VLDDDVGSPQRERESSRTPSSRPIRMPVTTQPRAAAHVGVELLSSATERAAPSSALGSLASR
jgi:hypothetical protein